MASRYGGITGSRKISEDFENINIAFENVEKEMDQNKGVVDNHLASKSAHNADSITYAGGATGGNVKQAIDGLDTRIDNIVAQAGDDNTEIVDARGGYPVLGDRLNAIDKRIGDLFYNVKDYGLVGDGVTNDLNAFLAMLAIVPEHSKIVFPSGTFLLTGAEIPINKEYITIDGEANLIMDYGFRPRKSYFKIQNLTMTCPVYSIEAIAVRVYLPTERVSDFQLLNCRFFNFFYACDFSGGDYYEPNSEILLSDVIVAGCYSSTWKDRNAGHFQSINVHNVSYQNNHTYGGQNATSYNAINTNGFLRIIGNYDDFNSYGSCEVENASDNVVVTGNTFGNTLWVDDAKNVIFNANVVQSKIFVTVSSNYSDAENVIISNNYCENLVVSSFGEYEGGIVKNLSIIGNTITVDPNDSAWGIFIDGSVCHSAFIRNNSLVGTYTSGAIGLVRSPNTTILIENNTIMGNVVSSGTGGTIYRRRNLFATYIGDFESFPVAWGEEISDGANWTASNGQKYHVMLNDAGEFFSVPY